MALKKNGLVEFFDSKDLPAGDPLADHKIVRFTVAKHTRFRDAKRAAFREARKQAKKRGFARVYYQNYSAQNPDFMNGTDRTPRHYRIDAVLF